MLHPLLQEIIDKNKPPAVELEVDKSLLDSINKAFLDLERKNEELLLRCQHPGTAAISTLDSILSDTFTILGGDKELFKAKAATVSEVIDRAEIVKELTSTKIKKIKQLEKEVSHSKNIQKIARAGSWEVDLTENIDSKQDYWSDELFNILGVKPGSIDLTYHSYLALIHPEDQGLFEREVSKAISSRGTYDIEYRILSGNGSERLVRDMGSVQTDPLTGAASKMVGITFDITHTRETENALASANAELQTLFDSMEEVFWSTDMVQNKVLQMSPACKRVYGYGPEDMKNDPELWLKVILDEDKQTVLSEVPRLESGLAIHNEYRIRHKDGQIRWLETRITPTLNIDGKLIRLDGINSDITAKKQAENALKKNELKFRSLIQNSNDAITIANDCLQFTFVSESMTGMTGFSPQEMLNTSILDYIYPENHATVQEMLVPLSENPGVPVYFEFPFRNKEGNWIWTEGHVTNLLHEEAVGGYVANFRDITERKTHERSLEISNEELKKTNNELDRFVYSVSHDLRAPLASVLGLLEYSQTETEDEEMLGNFELMKESIEKLDIFILDILDYSRNARVEVKKQKVDFRELLKEVNSSLKFMSNGKSDVSMKVNIPENSDFYSDKGRVSVILNNLVSNAMRYYNPNITDPYVQIDVSFNVEGVNIIVRDNGIGIDEKHHQKIFDMFFRVSTKSTGSGLGLYLVKETIDKLNGTLEFKSKPGFGTEFKIFLPNLA
ncbi:PAS domain-containing sensor histidine kinase [Desertivirga xinjiangensis]|uniref:PAS domain-containing sensor histidine kinase n=1 Tax=Desertivirga xinjiangensis TaxID=539206 RepID=UPI00210C91A7|nr:PAS domain-containing sensor histidine kinase [Pedobacter xinjiangensis]